MEYVLILLSVIIPLILIVAVGGLYVKSKSRSSGRARVSSLENNYDYNNDYDNEEY